MSPTKAERFYGAGGPPRYIGFGSGGFDGIEPGVKLLQEELGKLAAQTGNSDMAADRADGTMSLGTIMALSHAAGAVGTGVHPALGKALDVVNIIKSPLEKIPYAGQVIDIVLSPWLIDNVFSTVLAIMGIIPGAGDAANAARKAVDAFKAVLAGASTAIAAAIAAARQSIVAHPLGDDYPADAWHRPLSRREFGDPLGNPPLRPAGQPRAVIQVSGIGCAAGAWKTPAGVCQPIPACPTGTMWNIITASCTKFEIRNHTRWTAGRAIIPSEWSKTMQYRGKAPLADLAPADRDAYARSFAEYAQKYPPGVDITGQAGAQIQKALRSGIVAFIKFTGADGTAMGAFYNEATQELAVVPIPPKPKRHSKSLWGVFSDAVGGAIDFASGAIGDVIEATGDLLGDLWSAIQDQVEFVYDAVKKYGCALVSSDIVVGLAAAGAGIVATPATSAAIVSGAGAGRVACAVIEVGELVYAILKLLSSDLPALPPPIGTYTQMTVHGRSDAYTSVPTGQIVIPLPRPGASDGPPGYTLCAQWDSTCSFNGRASVAYGANGVFAYGTFDNSVKCGNDAFGGDPVPNVFKACYVQTSAAVGPAAGGAGRYKARSFTRYNTTTNRWSVYSPLAGALGCGSCHTGLADAGLGAAGEVVPPVPVGFVKVGEELAPPAGVVNAGQEQDKGSIWTNPYFWLAVAGGVVASGGGIYLLRRRRKR